MSVFKHFQTCKQGGNKTHSSNPFHQGGSRADAEPVPKIEPLLCVSTAKELAVFEQLQGEMATAGFERAFLDQMMNNMKKLEKEDRDKKKDKHIQ